MYSYNDRCTGSLAARGMSARRARVYRASESPRQLEAFIFLCVIGHMVKLYVGSEARRNVYAFVPVYQCWYSNWPTTIYPITQKEK